jgi:RNA polymerase sigma-70 factor (ECF subfamily)
MGDADLDRAESRTTYRNEDDIAAGLRRRDPDAMEALYDLVSRRAFGLAFRMLGDSQSAEDVLQESFLSIWRAAERIDHSRGRLQSYVLTVVHRRAIDALRSRKAAPAVELPEDLPLPDERVDVAGTVASEIDAEAVRGALAALPEDQRQAVDMAYFQGLTHVEIADALNLPLGTVKSRLRLAVDKLRVSLSGYWS